MIETRCLKNLVIFIQTILDFVLSRKIINIYNDIARNYGNVTIRKTFSTNYIDEFYHVVSCYLEDGMTIF